MKLPTSVRLGTQDFSVQFVGKVDPKDEDICGQVDVPTNSIRIRKGLPETRVAELILHEVVHAYLSGFEAEALTEETVAVVLGVRIAEFIVDNPKFIRWVQATRATKE